MIDTRTLKVSLPSDKFLAWRDDPCKVIHNKSTTLQGLESLIGRLNHASFLIPLGRHFLNGLRGKIPKNRGKGTRMWASKWIHFSRDNLEDLNLWLKFLAKTREDISMNLLTIRRPTRIAWSGSCLFGFGGYTLKGTAWRVKLDSRWIFWGDDLVNNLLEFLGMTVSILLMIKEAKSEREGALLALGDNTLAIGWIFKSGRLPKSSKYYYPAKKMAQKIAEEAIQADVRILAQHLRGTYNDVADLLSFEGDHRGKINPLTADRPDDQTLTLRLHKHYHQIIPKDFQISNLPPEINSFIYATLETIEESRAPNKRNPGVSQREPGDLGNASPDHSESVIHSLTTSPNTPGNSSPGVSYVSSEITSPTSRSALLYDVRNLWWH